MQTRKEFNKKVGDLVFTNEPLTPEQIFDTVVEHFNNMPEDWTTSLGYKEQQLETIATVLDVPNTTKGH